MEQYINVPINNVGSFKTNSNGWSFGHYPENLKKTVFYYKLMLTALPLISWNFLLVITKSDKQFHINLADRSLEIKCLMIEKKVARW